MESGREKQPNKTNQFHTLLLYYTIKIKYCQYGEVISQKNHKCKKQQNITPVPTKHSFTLYTRKKIENVTENRESLQTVRNSPSLGKGEAVLSRGFLYTNRRQTDTSAAEGVTVQFLFRESAWRSALLPSEP